MMAAILQERISNDEGFWYDQGCIDQNNEEEKSVAIGLMDIIYRKARAVVVALDMTVAREQLEAIEEYKMVYDEECATLGEDIGWGLVRTERSEKLLPELAKKHFREFVEAFLNSAWFGRAWCDHEARLAPRLIFLAACEPSGHDDGDSLLFLRFTDCFAYNILDNFVETWDTDPEKDRAHIRKGRRKLMNICHRITMREIVERARKLGPVAPIINKGIGDSRDSLLKGAMEIFNTVAGGDQSLDEDSRILSANRDKLSIALHTLELGIILKNSPKEDWRVFSEEKCLRMIVLLGLADRNTAALCTNSYPLLLEGLTKQPEQGVPRLGFSCFSRPSENILSWHIPQLAKSMVPQYGQKSGMDFIRLECAVLESDGSNRSHYPRMPLHRPTYRGPVTSAEGLSSIQSQKNYFMEMFREHPEGYGQFPDLGLDSKSSTFKKATSFFLQCIALKLDIALE